MFPIKGDRFLKPIVQDHLPEGEMAGREQESLADSGNVLFITKICELKPGI